MLAKERAPTNLVRLSDLAMLERIEIILDMRNSTLFDRPDTKERVVDHSL